MKYRSLFLVGLAGTLPLGCALSNIDSDFDKDGGVASVGGGGGKSSTGGKPAANGGTATSTSTGTAASGGVSNAGGTSTRAATSTVGGNTAAGGTSSAAGSTALAGATATGGASQAGGTKATGGSATGVGGSTSGGTSSTGGTSRASGTVTTGGLSYSGGTTSAGGGTASGGLTAVGGSAGTSGVTGGSTAAGGTPPTGGTANAGGTSNTGGASAGGATSTGGATSAPIAVQVTAGDNHACALLSDGSLWCWGSNQSGQLGQDTSTVTNSTIPMQKTDAALGKIASMTAGGAHTCVLLTNGQAQCWGNNIYGQLGNGTTTSSYQASTVMLNSTTPLSGVVQISAGYQTTCAVVKDNTAGTVAKCWGSGEDGELGNGRSGSSYIEKYPITVITSTSGSSPVLANVQTVSVGYQHVCATVGSGNTSYCWGSNSYGQLGNGTTTDSSFPAAVKDTGGAVVSADTLAAMDYSTCALNSGAVQCWGANDYGQLGNGSTDASSPVPVGVKLKATALRLSAYDYDACVVDKNGAIECWGDSSYGTLGLDPYAGTACNGQSYACSNLPIIVAFPNAATDSQVAAGGWFTTVVDAKGSIFSIGYNGSGDLGNGNGQLDYSSNPVEIYYSWLL